jgi:hypothetical protein
MSATDYQKRYGKPQISSPVKVSPFVKPQVDFTRWKDKNALGLGRETLERNIDRVTGKDAPAIKKLLVESSRKNETARTQFANDLRRNTRQYVVKGLGIKPGSKQSELVQKYGEKLIDEGDLVKQVGEIEASKIINASNYFRKHYDKLIDDWNIVRKKYGFEPIPKRKDYFRHFQAIDQNANILGTIKNAKDLPTEISGITDIFNPSKPFSDAALQRKGNKTTFDAVKGFDNYIDSVSRQIFHTDTVQKGRALEGAIRKAAVGNPSLELPNFVANLHEWTNLVSGKKTRVDRAAEALVGRKVYAASNALRSKTGANMIGANIGSALTNFVPFTQAAATTSKAALVKGMRDTASSAFAKDKTVIDGVKSGFLTRRFPQEAISLTKTQKASEVASTPFRAIDSFSSRSIVAGKYFENRAKGMSKADAMKAADDYAGRVMTDRSAGQLPNLLKTNTVGVVAQFQAEVNNQVSFLTRDIPQFANGNKLKIASSLAQFVMYSYLLNAGYQKIMGRRVQLDPLDAALNLANPNKSGAQKTNALKQDILGGLPFTSIFTGGRLPVNATFPDFSNTAKGVKDLATGDKNKAGRELYKGLSGPAFYLAPPFGGGQAKKMIDAATSFSKGYSETPTGNVRFPLDSSNKLDLAKGLAFGQYATNQGQKYIQRVPKPLSSTQSKNFEAKAPDQQQNYFDAIQKLHKAKVDATAGNINKVLMGQNPSHLLPTPKKTTKSDLYYRTNDGEYRAFLSQYNQNVKAGSYDAAQKITATKKLNKLKIGATYPKSVRDLYNLSKSDLYKYLTTKEKGKDKVKISKQLKAYDTALYNAGLISYRKFKTGLAPSKGRSGGGGSGSSSAKKALTAKVNFDFSKKPITVVGAIPPPKKLAAPKFTSGLKTVYHPKALSKTPTVTIKRAKF